MLEHALIDKITSTNLQLPVMEHFYTLQGEGYFSGQAAYFVRLAGCDVGCVWCDVKESWDATLHPLKSVDEIVAGAKSHQGKLCVITGGEPLLYDLTHLTKALHEAGFIVNIETSASSPFTGHWDWICISPKKFKAPLPENMLLAHELKIIVFNISDFEWAEKQALMVSPTCKLYLQPEWDKANEILPLIINYIKDHPQWQLSLQTHKFLNIP
ncbi:MAG: 7-carboxy-7-deazaguanine synthase QueE [Bacteroidetes bacterium]|nr:7-carboxy-7-deazaguanine synthase QueE [Bacteroidota bacterium]